MKSNYLYFRGLRHVEHAVFCVDGGQKTYRDPTFQRTVAYSSGQQVKRSLIEAALQEVGASPAPVTFNFNVKEKNGNQSLEEGEAWSPCDPTFADQLLGGWMKAEKGGDNRTIKRRSPLSISAMRPLHPLLGGYTTENITFDRSDRPGVHAVIVKDSDGNVLNDTEIAELLEGNDRSLRRKWVPDQRGSNARTSGLFVYDAAIDLRTLFCVSTNQLEPELAEETIDKLKQAGWKESKNVFGSCLVCPKERRDEIIEALAHGLINWRITSNQSRTFSLMETLTVAISDNGNQVAGAIRAQLSEEEDNKATPILDETAGAKIYRALPIDGYIRGEYGSADALKQAEGDIVARLSSYDYENQLS